jgi:uncharacterized protein (DUF486 family)
MDTLLKFSVMGVKGLYTIGLLALSNIFMTLAWYGHLKFSGSKRLAGLGLFAVIPISWGIAFFEYCMQVPANRIGFKDHGGPFSLLELKVIQEVVTLLVFVLFSLIFFKQESFKWNHFAGMACMVLAVYFIFRK